MQPETRYAIGPAGRIAYQLIGDGPLDLVFVPHLTSNVDVMWEEPLIARFLSRLASFSRLLCFDKRGTGVSDPAPPDAVTLEHFMEDVRVVMDAVGFKRAALVGQGNGGGGMAILFAATYPARTSALVLVDTPAGWLRDTDYPGLRPEQIPKALKSIEDTWGTGSDLDFLAPSLAHDERFRRWWARYERLAMAPRAVVTMYSAVLQTDVRGVLPAIRVPTLVMQRVGDHHVRVGHGRYIAEHIAGAKYVELPGEDYLFFAGADADAMLGEIEEFLTGTRSPPDFDRVLATVLFTDIVGSTERAAELGDRAWRSLVDGYYAIARRQLESHRGKEVETAGDGFLATFDGPARAIRCACAMTQGVRALGVELRAGLHTGEIELAQSGIRGIAVHTAARVAGEAAAGEVLVSNTVKDLVAGSGIQFTDRGAHVLKGVPGEWRLFSATP